MPKTITTTAGPITREETPPKLTNTPAPVKNI